MTPIRILVVDDHPVVRDGLAAVLDTQEDMTVVAQAVDGRDGLAQLARLEVDVALVDLEMPNLDGIGFLHAARDDFPETRVIVFTAYDTDERILDAVHAGAAGYLLKGAPRRELFEAVRVVQQGGTLLQPVVATRLLEHIQSEAQRPLLTPREADVLGHLAKGLLNKEIGDQLGISERTVKFHVSSLLAKLDAGNRTEALSRASRLGLVDLEES